MVHGLDGFGKGKSCSQGGSGNGQTLGICSHPAHSVAKIPGEECGTEMVQAHRVLRVSEEEGKGISMRK